MLSLPYIIVCPLGTASCFYDIVLALADSLGVPAGEIIGDKEIPPSADMRATFFLFGLNVPEWFTRWPADTFRYVAMQCEQFSSHWFNDDAYIRRLKGATEIWDYSTLNVSELTKRFHFANYFYKQCVVKVPPVNLTLNAPRDIELLFTGSEGYRRELLINGFRRRRPDWNIVWIKDCCWGEQRNALIQRAHVVLNIHYYEYAILEVPRILAALCAGAVVVSEPSEDKELDAEFAPYVAIVADQEQLLDQCEYFIKNPAAADRLRDKGKEWALARTYKL